MLFHHELSHNYAYKYGAVIKFVLFSKKLQAATLKMSKQILSYATTLGNVTVV